MAIYTGERCFWCGKQDMTVMMIDPSGEKPNFHLCIPCLVDVREQWLEEDGSQKSHLTRIK